MSSRYLLIGGSGAYQFSGEVFGRRLSREVIGTPFGESTPFSLYEKDGFPFYFTSRHGEAGYEVSAPFVNYRAIIYAARLLGVERVVAWSGPGIINEELHPGGYLIPTDIIDFTGRRGSTFFAGSGLGFIRQNPVFCPDMGKALARQSGNTGRAVRQQGTYVCTDGPRLETPAEIRMLGLFGGDVVGMTIAPEVFLARELEMCYHPICYLTNYAEGVKAMPYREGVLFEGILPEEMVQEVERAKELLPGICISSLKILDGMERGCPCSVSMERYKKEGRIGDDFREWIKGGKG